MISTVQRNKVLLKEYFNLCDELNCAICKDLFDNPVTLTACEHTFCHDCFKKLFQYLKKGQSLKCPLCFIPINRRSYQFEEALQPTIEKFKVLKEVLFRELNITEDKNGNDSGYSSEIMAPKPEKLKDSKESKNSKKSMTNTDKSNNDMFDTLLPQSIDKPYLTRSKISKTYEKKQKPASKPQNTRYVRKNKFESPKQIVSGFWSSDDDQVLDTSEKQRIKEIQSKLDIFEIINKKKNETPIRKTIRKTKSLNCVINKIEPKKPERNSTGNTIYAVDDMFIDEIENQEIKENCNTEENIIINLLEEECLNNIENDIYGPSTSKSDSRHDIDNKKKISEKKELSFALKNKRDSSDDSSDDSTGWSRLTDISKQVNKAKKQKKCFQLDISSSSSSKNGKRNNKNKSKISDLSTKKSKKESKSSLGENNFEKSTSNSFSSKSSNKQIKSKISDLISDEAINQSKSSDIPRELDSEKNNVKISTVEQSKNSENKDYEENEKRIEETENNQNEEKLEKINRSRDSDEIFNAPTQVLDPNCFNEIKTEITSRENSSELVSPNKNMYKNNDPDVTEIKTENMSSENASELISPKNKTNKNMVEDFDLIKICSPEVKKTNKTNPPKINTKDMTSSPSLASKKKCPAMLADVIVHKNPDNSVLNSEKRNENLGEINSDLDVINGTAISDVAPKRRSLQKKETVNTVKSINSDIEIEVQGDEFIISDNENYAILDELVQCTNVNSAESTRNKTKNTAFKSAIEGDIISQEIISSPLDAEIQENNSPSGESGYTNKDFISTSSEDARITKPIRHKKKSNERNSELNKDDYKKTKNLSVDKQDNKTSNFITKEQIKDEFTKELQTALDNSQDFFSSLSNTIKFNQNILSECGSYVTNSSSLFSETNNNKSSSVIDPDSQPRILNPYPEYDSLPTYLHKLSTENVFFFNTAIPRLRKLNDLYNTIKVASQEILSESIKLSGTLNKSAPENSNFKNHKCDAEIQTDVLKCPKCSFIFHFKNYPDQQHEFSEENCNKFRKENVLKETQNQSQQNSNKILKTGDEKDQESQKENIPIIYISSPEKSDQSKSSKKVNRKLKYENSGQQKRSFKRIRTMSSDSDSDMENSKKVKHNVYSKLLCQNDIDIVFHSEMSEQSNEPTQKQQNSKLNTSIDYEKYKQDIFAKYDKIAEKKGQTSKLENTNNEIDKNVTSEFQTSSEKYISLLEREYRGAQLVKPTSEKVLAQTLSDSLSDSVFDQIDLILNKENTPKKPSPELQNITEKYISVLENEYNADLSLNLVPEKIAGQTENDLTINTENEFEKNITSQNIPLSVNNNMKNGNKNSQMSENKTSQMSLFSSDEKYERLDTQISRKSKKISASLDNDKLSLSLFSDPEKQNDRLNISIHDLDNVIAEVNNRTHEEEEEDNVDQEVANITNTMNNSDDDHFVDETPDNIVDNTPEKPPAAKRMRRENKTLSIIELIEPDNNHLTEMTNTEWVHNLAPPLEFQDTQRWTKNKNILKEKINCVTNVSSLTPDLFGADILIPDDNEDLINENELREIYNAPPQLNMEVSKKEISENETKNLNPIVLAQNDKYCPLQIVPTPKSPKPISVTLTSKQSSILNYISTSQKSNNDTRTEDDKNRSILNAVKSATTKQSNEFTPTKRQIGHKAGFTPTKHLTNDKARFTPTKHPIDDKAGFTLVKNSPQGIASRSMLNMNVNNSARKNDAKASLTPIKSEIVATSIRPLPVLKVSNNTSSANKNISSTSSRMNTSGFSSDVTKICIACSRLGKEGTTTVMSFCKKINAKYSNDFSTIVTHLIVFADEKNVVKDHTIKIVSAIAHGIWVLSFNWIKDCLSQGRLIPEEPYEVLDVSGNPGPKTSRLTRKFNPLFKDYQFFCSDPLVSVSRNDLENVIISLGGEVTRCIDDLRKVSGKFRMILSEAKVTEDFNNFQEWRETLGVLVVEIEWLSQCVCQYQISSARPFMLCLDEGIENLGYPEYLVLQVPESPSQMTNVTFG